MYLCEFSEKKELKKFWEGKIGKKYIKRMEDTKTQLLNAAMGAPTPDDAFKYASIANGFESVLQDIKAATTDEEKAKKEEAAEETK